MVSLHHTDRPITAVTAVTGSVTAANGSPLNTVSTIIEFYIQPMFVLVGVIGNILSFKILSLPSYKHQSTCMYMKGMAISDSIFLIFFVLQRTIISIKNEQLRNWDGFKWLCRQYLFWQFYAGTVSAITLQTMSMERLFALMFPLKAKTWCSVQKAKRFVTTLFIILAVILFPLQFFRERQKRFDGWRCPYHFNGDLANVYDHFRATVSVFIPFIVISLSNIGIVCVLKISGRRREDMKAAPKTATNNQIIRMLIVVSTVFLVCRLPNKIRLPIWFEYWRHYTGDITAHISALQRFSVTLTNNLDICNYAFNSYLYILPVKRFRQDARNLCCGRAIH
jgi:hypothetical protein